MGARLEATLLRDALSRLAECDTAIKSSDDATLDGLVDTLQQKTRSIRSQTRRGDDADARAMLTNAEFRHQFTLVANSTEQQRAIIDVVNRVRSKAVAGWIAVLEGTSTIADEMPPPEHGLLLQSLTGNSPEQCLEHWAGVKGGARNLKTYDKFKGIADDLAAILDGQSVEALTRDHVQLYADYLRGTGNALNTIHGKLGIWATLLANANISPDTRKSLSDIRPPKARARQHSAPRKPFEMDQLGAILEAFFTDTSLPPDDRVVVALQALSGARLEEICSLTGPQINWNGRYWVIDFVEADVPRKTARTKVPPKKAEALKCLDSVRAVPVVVSSIAGLHERLVTLKSQAGPGRLFSHLTTNCYGAYSGAIGKRLNKRIDRVLGDDRRLVLESLRNTAAPAMRRAGVDGDERRMFMGHAPIDIHARHYDLPTTRDLVTAAQAVSHMVAQALDGRSYPTLDTLYRERRIRRSRHQLEAPQFPLSRAPIHQAGMSLENGQTNGRLDAGHGLHQDVDGHVPVTSPDLAIAVPSESVVDVLRNSCSPTQCLESVPEGMEDQALVFKAATLPIPEVTSPPFGPVPAAFAESVRGESGKQPLIACPTTVVHVPLKADTNEFRVNRDHSDRCTVLDPSSQSVGADVNQEPMEGVRFNIAQTQLAQLLESAPGQQSDGGQPGASFAPGSPWSQASAENRRRKHRGKLLRIERTSSNGKPFLARHTKTTKRITFLKSGIDRGLHHGTQMSKLLRDGLWVQRSREQSVPIGGGLPTAYVAGWRPDKGVEGRGRGAKLNQRPAWPVRIDGAPVVEKPDEGVVRRTRLFRTRGTRRRLRLRTIWLKGAPASALRR